MNLSSFDLPTEFLFQHPWVVAIMRDQDNDIHCTGSIISSKYILTAAHCMIDVDRSKLEIVLGAKNLKDPRNSKRGVIKKRISGYQLHDKYEGGADYDIAVVEVVDEIPFEVSTFLGCQAY